MKIWLESEIDAHDSKNPIIYFDMNLKRLIIWKQSIGTQETKFNFSIEISIQYNLKDNVTISTSHTIFYPISAYALVISRCTPTM